MTNPVLFVVFLAVLVSHDHHRAQCLSFFHFVLDPPPVTDIATMARYIVHNSDWATLSYIGNQSFMDSMPMGRVYSISDGTVKMSTGIPYIMASPMDLSFQDVMETKNCSLVLSLAQSDYCNQKSYDPEDPRCAQVILTGQFVTLDKDDPEYKIAKLSLWTRHPVMRHWNIDVPGHRWQFSKIKIEHITLLDTFGGRKYPSVLDYFSAKPIIKHKTKYTFEKQVIIVDELGNDINHN